ncbi:tetratricopeptide repeat protein [Leptothoe spongobia]|uniref:Tetratricopeptide repeat protein n=1 Tax=Leptothoe spongobia TAU-MAC 1115 TaxID=1967444 RepID=A0A947DH41_9CYAN|nr:tetratricopeptide repeat protein [Leptothoe spongobia]MBT9316289.1 tetratricopeptide repeat protein [Leptothoe spongobia TAU-MAC 1115]
MTSSDVPQPSPNPAQEAFKNVRAGRDINATINQELNYYPAPREKPAGIPNNSPPGTGKFVGRTQAMTVLHTQLMEHSSGVAAIVGMGGLGKSELAIQYASRYQNSYPGGICWLNARTGDVLTQLIQYCQLQLGMVLPQKLAQQSLSVVETATWYIAHWRLDGTVLVVLDDVVTLSDCKPLLDLLKPPFRTLMTTRDQLLDASFFKVPLEVLYPDDALELLTALVGNRIQAEQTTAQTLCETLGYLPLGIELVGRYLSTNPFVSVTEVSQNISLRSQQLMPQPVSMMANQRGVWAAFELSWNQLDEAAQQLGELLSFFAPGDISWELVEQVMALTDLEEAALTTAQTTLYQQSLLQKADGETLRLHPLIQEFFTAQRQQHPHQEDWQQAYIQGLANFASDIPYVLVLEDINRLTPAIPHIVALLRHPLDLISDENLEPLFTGTTRFYHSQAIYTEAQHWAEQGYAVLKERLGEENPDIARILNDLANLYSNQRCYSEAEPLYLQALEITKRTLDEEHPYVARSLNNLAILYYEQGRYSEAESLYLQALEITKRTLGEEHPNVANSLNNLAILYYDQRHYSEAESLYLQALEITKRTLGEEHPYVANRLNNLAILYSKQGRYSEAEPLYLQALEITKRTLGEEHPDVANSLNNLAILYYEQGRYSEAEPLYLQALEITKRTLGEEHPNVANSLNNLAILRRGKHFRRALSIVRLGLLGLLLGISIHILIVFFGTLNPKVLFWLIIFLIVGVFLWKWHPR